MSLLYICRRLHFPGGKLTPQVVSSAADTGEEFVFASISRREGAHEGLENVVFMALGYLWRVTAGVVYREVYGAHM